MLCGSVRLALESGPRACSQAEVVSGPVVLIPASNLPFALRSPGALHFLCFSKKERHFWFCSGVVKFLIIVKFFCKGPESRKGKSKEDGEGENLQSGILGRETSLRNRVMPSLEVSEKATTTLISSLCGPPETDEWVGM